MCFIVRMASNLIPRILSGIGAEAQDVDEHVLDDNGRMRSFDEIVRRLSSPNWAAFAVLEHHIREALRKPRARGYPPRIFISYRRETSHHRAWCIELAKAIEALGYEIYLDELEIEQNEPDDRVAEFVSKLADSDIALVVVTDSYLGQDNSMRAWLYHEWSRIQTLQGWGILEVILAVRSAKGPTPFMNLEASHSRLLSLRPSPDDFTSILEFLGKYTGPHYSRDDQARLAATAASVIAEARAGNSVVARSQLAEISKLDETEEYRLARTYILAAEGDRDGAVEEAVSLIQTNPSLPTAAEAAKKLWLLDADLQAFPTLAEIAEIPSFWRLQTHYMMADILWRNGMPHAAINHFTWCLWAAGDENLDFSRAPGMYPEMEQNLRARLAKLWFLVGDVEEYENYFSSVPEAGLTPLWDDVALMLEAAAIQSDPMTMINASARCRFCRAIYFQNGWVCVVCGACYGRLPKDMSGQLANDCRMCHKPGAVVLHKRVSFCVTCRTSREVFLDDRPTPVIMLTHGPGGVFSVLPHKSGGRLSYRVLAPE